jgi:DNA-directed RNA polymerase subunit alpha
LSSLEGSAVTQIKLGGAQHEFTTIKGVQEDVTDIVLAVKSLVVKNHSDSTRVVRVEKSLKGPITGADVQVDESVEVVSKDLVLATLTDDVPFELEMVIENGRGYVPSSEHSPDGHEIGIIPVDAVFSPVTRVRYEVEETRVGQKTNYDKLTLEVWTDGTITPEMALVEAAKILRKHLNPFVGYTSPGASIHAAAGDTGSTGAGSGGAGVLDLEKLEAPLDSRLGMLISQLSLSHRAENSLIRNDITTLGQLVKKTRDEVANLQSAGEQTLQEIEDKLKELGVSFGMESIDTHS